MEMNKVYHMDCLNGLKELEDNSIDAIVTDPPYGLSKEPNIEEVLTKWINGEPYDHKHKGFMGKDWDSFVPHPNIWKECYRTLKPGGHMLVFAGTRTQDLMTISLRLAGFEVRDVVEWLYFTGFPKSHDISKAMDKKAGAEREIIGTRIADDIRNNNLMKASVKGDSSKHVINITAPKTEQAKKYEGYGTALKPAHEPIILVRKPFKGSVADNVLEHGTGGINIDGCRIGTEEEMEKGRFPANCITLEEHAFYSKFFNISPSELSKKASKKDRNSNYKGEEIGLEEKKTGHGNLKKENGFERFDTKNKNNHPTVKPVSLMEWLIKLITPENGIICDPFSGSGTTLVAAKKNNFNFIGFELNEEYIEIIEERLKDK